MRNPGSVAHSNKHGLPDVLTTKDVSNQLGHQDLLVLLSLSAS
jgi:hypothetical protein